MNERWFRRCGKRVDVYLSRLQRRHVYKKKNNRYLYYLIHVNILPGLYNAVS